MAKLPTFIAVGALLGIALPGTITAAAAREAAAPKPKAVADTNGKPLICVREPAITGSILPRRTCKTRADWQADGIDIDKLAAASSH
jgi:hypothetical protein